MYRLFSEYLKEREKLPESLFPLTIAFIFGMTGVAVASPIAAAIATPIGIVTLIWASSVRRVRAKRARELGGGETADWFRALCRFRHDRQLESRSYPDIIRELEACAELRHSILKTLTSPDWKELANLQEWGKVAELCKQVTEDLMVDAVWAARPLFRAHGARRSTFEKRCEDPSYTSLPLGTVRLARSQLERMLDDVSNYPLASLRATDALARALVELNSIREAEREIHGPG